MKKIPTMFERVFHKHKVAKVLPVFTSPEAEKALKEGVATLKVDGSCCAIIDGVFYKRYDAKKGKTPPAGAIACCEPDPVTGHHPHWVMVDPENPSDKWFLAAYKNSDPEAQADGTFEAIGPHFNGNPYGWREDFIVRHGAIRLYLSDRSFEGVREMLTMCYMEGIVFWLNNEPVCKIKRTDFGLKWPPTEAQEG